MGTLAKKRLNLFLGEEVYLFPIGILFIKSEPHQIFSPNFLTFNFNVSNILMGNQIMIKKFKVYFQVFCQRG